jgi:hypothetical protein
VSVVELAPILRAARRPAEGAASYAMAGGPRLEAGRAGSPALDLAVLLSARPSPAAPALANLVECGFVSLGVSVAPTLVERLELELRSGGRAFLRAQADGPAARIDTRGILAAADAIALLGAIDGWSGVWLVLTARYTLDGRPAVRVWECLLRDLVGEGGDVAATYYYPDPARPAHFRELEPLVTVAASRNGGARGNRAAPAPVQHLIARGEPAPVSRELALMPDRSVAPIAHAMLASNMIHFAGAGTWAAHDLLLPTAPAVESLPVVTDIAAPLWPDRASATRRYYGPSFSLRLPSPDDPFETADFAFELTRLGATTDPEQPALTASVRFSLDVGPGQAVTDALAAADHPEAAPVPLGNLSARLQVPVRDVQTQELRFQPFAATVESSGGVVTVTVELQGEFVRLLYGALAYPGYQSAPPRLELAYAFSAYVPVSDVPIRLAQIDKIAMVPLVMKRGAAADAGGPMLDPAAAAIQLPGGTVSLGRELPPAGARRAGPMAVALHHFTPVALTATHAVATVPAATVAAPAALVAAHPNLALSATAVAVLAEPRYAVQTLVREISVDVVLPCATYGPLYRENTDAGSEPIGCKDVLRLGQLEYHLYDELTTLRAPTHRVFRALQQPGRFLLLPTRYRIGRYAASEPDARRYRPVALIYALVGDDPGGSTYWFTATLEPDIQEFVRAQLLLDLAPLVPHGQKPVLDLPTDAAVNAAVAWSWALPDGVGEPQAQASWNGIQVAVSTGLHEAVVLKEVIEHSGLHGAATFVLPDGSPPLPTELVVDTSATGPWLGGPVPTAIAGTSVRLRNAVEQRVDVAAVHVLRGGTLERLPLALSLDPGAEYVLDSAPPPEAAYAEVAASAPVPLAELGVFEEDVATNVHFVNQVSLARHDLSALSVQARVAGSARQYEAPLEDQATATLDLVFPLTAYLEGQSVEYRLTATPTSGPARQGPWMTWDLATAGSVIGVTADQLP